MVFNNVAYLPHFKRRNEQPERRTEKLVGFTLMTLWLPSVSLCLAHVTSYLRLPVFRPLIRQARIVLAVLACRRPLLKAADA
jgi:hypothetical protein